MHRDTPKVRVPEPGAFAARRTCLAHEASFTFAAETGPDGTAQKSHPSSCISVDIQQPRVGFRRALTLEWMICYGPKQSAIDAKSIILLHRGSNMA